MEQLIKPKVLAERWGVSVRTLTRMEKDGKLTPIWIGSRKRYKQSEIEALVQDAENNAGAVEGEDAGEPDRGTGRLAS